MSTREQAAASAALPPVERLAQREVIRDERFHDLYALLTNKRKECSLEVAQLRELLRKGREGADGADADEMCQMEDAAGTTASRVALLVRNMDKLDQARLALETGTYGICTDCGEEIPAKRLEALIRIGSAAERCLDCQTRKEGESTATPQWVPIRESFASPKED